MNIQVLLTYINDLDDTMTSNVLKFVDNTKQVTKVFRKVKNNGDKQQLQNDLDIFVKWSKNY